MSWRLAKSLVSLRNELNTAYGGRSKVSDGSIGDLAHSSRVSDHTRVSRLPEKWGISGLMIDHKAADIAPAATTFRRILPASASEK